MNFLVSSGLLFVLLAFYVKNDNNRFNASSSISELKPEVWPIIQLHALNATSIS